MATTRENGPQKGSFCPVLAAFIGENHSQHRGQHTVLDRLVDATADDTRTRRALDQKPCLHGFAETSYRAKSWKTD